MSCDENNYVDTAASSIVYIIQEMTPEKRQNDEMFIFDLRSLFVPRGNLFPQEGVGEL